MNKPALTTPSSSIPSKPQWVFPLSGAGCPGVPPNYHPGGFGFHRRHDVHTGVDLYCQPGAEVYAVEDGVVIDRGLFTGPALGHGWWLQTHYLTVLGVSGQIVYGEIATDRRINDIVRKGEMIGRVVPVLPPEKLRSDIPGHSTAMLHFEWLRPPTGYANAVVKPFSVSLGQAIPNLLVDPTAMLLAASGAAGPLPEWSGSLVPEPPIEVAATAEQISAVFQDGQSVQFHEDRGEMRKISNGWRFVPLVQPENLDVPARYSIYFPSPEQATLRPGQPEYLRIPDSLGLTRKVRVLPT